MDIRSVARGIFNIGNAKKAEPVREKKTEDSSKDRDANGQQTRDEGHAKRHLTPEEVEQSLKHLNGLKGIKDNNLKIEIVEDGFYRTFLILGPDQEVVRRIPEYEMLNLIKDQDKQTGQIFRKAM